jgi:tetratricopeptide (TPR) repeat protein
MTHPNFRSKNREANMRILCSVLLVIFLHLTPHSVRADTIACESPDLGLPNTGAREQINALQKQATECVREKKPGRAVAILTQIIKNDPTNAGAYLNRGTAQAALGEIFFAFNDYTTALRLAPDMLEAWYNRGTTLTHMRRFESAIADFTEAIRLKPDFALAYCNRGVSEVELGRYDDALADYSIAVSAAPDLSYCHFNRGNLYLILGEWMKAISDYTTALGERPSDPTALSRRGQAYEAIAQTKQALDDYNAALEINPRIESAREGVARLMEQQKHSELRSHHALHRTLRTRSLRPRGQGTEAGRT